MKFTVDMRAVETGASQTEMKAVIENAIFPTFEILQGWERENRVWGGLPVGERRISFVLEADSPKHADELIKQLPAWGVTTTSVQALTTFGDRLESDRELLKRI
jgi:hypothetical protein